MDHFIALFNLPHSKLFDALFTLINSRHSKLFTNFHIFDSLFFAILFFSSLEINGILSSVIIRSELQIEVKKYFETYRISVPL